MRTLCITLLLFLFLSTCARGNDYFVTDFTDGNNPTQLRGAVAAAEAAGAGPHTIHLAAGTYSLTLGQIIFGARAVTIHFEGEDAATTIISMSNTNTNRIFAINISASILDVHVSFNKITFTNGYLRSDIYGGGAILCGGPSNSVTITNCNFLNNSIDGDVAGTNGGAISISGGGTFIIDRCVFNGNSTPAGDGGAIYYGLHLGTGSLRITNSVFNFNSVTDNNGAGGAIGILVFHSSFQPSEIVIQKNVFVSNKADATGGDGGAISIRNHTEPENTAYINYNRFIANSANNFSTSALEMISGIGIVDATNNWWGCNNDPLSFNGCQRAFITGAGGEGTLLTSPRLQLKTSVVPGNICTVGETSNATVTASLNENSAGELIDPANLSIFTNVVVTFIPVQGTVSHTQAAFQPDGTATTTFTSNGSPGNAMVNAAIDQVPGNDPISRSVMTVNNPPDITFHPSNRTVCTGNQAVFTAEGEGDHLDYQWYRGTEPLTDGTTPSGAVIEGANTSLLSIQHTSEADKSSEYHVKVSRLGCGANSTNAELFVIPPRIRDYSGTVVGKVSSANHSVNDNSCERFVMVEPAGTDPINGELTASLTIAAGQLFHNGQPYVRRFYNITPAESPDNATANITLYFRQLDFDLYNAARPGTGYDLPNDPADMQGRNNLRITQYHGAGTLPGTYTGWQGDGPAAVLINPGAENVVWNSDYSWWEVSFPVTGFSGFFVTGLIDGALPVTIHRITASPAERGIMVEWQVSDEVNFKHYEIETSSDGTSFHTVGIVPAANKTLYNFLHATPAPGTNYYRLKLVDIDGDFSYSRTVSCLAGGLVNRVNVMRNPFVQNLQLKVDVQENMQFKLNLADQSGRLLLQKTIYVSRGLNTITIPEANNFAKGMYVLHVSGQGLNETIKVVKIE